MCPPLPKVQIAEAFADLFTPSRYKLYYGGRGGAKSWAFARALIIRALQKPIRILCCREFQNSIRQSVHQLLAEQIDRMGLGAYFRVKETTIEGVNGSEFLFMGLARNIQGIKSTENITIAWVEEAQTISQPSLDLLIPTIRAPNSEIWFSWNPLDEEAPIERLKESLVNDSVAILQKVGWQDNPWFPKELEAERKRLLSHDPSAYEHVWEGHFKVISDAVIFKDRVVFEPFETPSNTRFYHGVDWGFAVDPTAVVRCFIKDQCLYVDVEAVAHKVEIDQMTLLFNQVPTMRRWPIKADSARPETISHMARRGFNITEAKKWNDSVEDGITYLKSFNKIIVHPRCRHTASEFRRYSYKVDKQTEDILPVVEDANNHCIDALRYALDGLIKMEPRTPIFSQTALNRIRSYGTRRRI